MKFSIIISLYNQKKYLPKIVEAWENQQLKDFEIHFCDDGSTDGTKEWIKSHSFSFPFKYYRNKPSKKMKLTKVLNKGIKKAKGEYCVFVMGDSFPEVDYLQIIDEFVNPDSIICGVRANIDDKKLIELDWRIRKNLIPKQAVMLPSHPYDMITGNGLTIPTEAMRKYGGWNKKIQGYGGDDNEIVARLYYRGYIVWSVPQAVVYHHWHPSKLESTDKRKFLNKLIHQYAS